MILAQRMATASTIRTRLAELQIDKQRFLRENKMQGAKSSLTAAMQNYPYKTRIDYEIKKLTGLLAFEVAMISKMIKEIGIGGEELSKIKEWEELLSSPMKLERGENTSDPGSKMGREGVPALSDDTHSAEG